MRFEWANEYRKQGEGFWKRSEFREHDGKLHFRYDSMEPSASAADDNANADAAQELITFEGVWNPGNRPAGG